MSIFNRNRRSGRSQESNYGTIVWRDSSGKIVCPGDACPKECDNSCPIWCNTIGLQMISVGHLEKARDNFLCAINIAPDFADAYQNLGSVYGMVNNHEEARLYFLKALENKKVYPEAMRSLIIAEKNLELYDQALSHCNEYEQYPGCDPSELRDSVLTARRNNNYLYYADYLLEQGRNRYLLKSEQIIEIQELTDLADPAFSPMSTGLRELFSKDQNKQYIKTLFACASYLGICAAFLWNNDQNTLKSMGLFESATAPRGLSEMDEFAMDSIGVSVGSMEEKAFRKFLDVLGNNILEEMVQNGTDILWTRIRAMFLLGETYAFEKIKTMGKGIRGHG